MSRSTMSDSSPQGTPDFDPTYRDAVIAAMGHRLAAAGPRTRQRLLDRQVGQDVTAQGDTGEHPIADRWPAWMGREDDDWDVPAPEQPLFGFIPPWQECVAAARRFALLGTAAGCGFAVVLLGLSQHVGAPHRKAGGAHAAEEANLEVAPPVVLASATTTDSGGGVGTVQPASAAAPAPAVSPAPAFETPAAEPQGNSTDVPSAMAQTTPSTAMTAPPAEPAASLTASNVAVPAQPEVAQPVVTQPVVAQPVVAQPVVAQPVVAPSVVAQPVVTQPVVAQPVVAQPVVAESAEHLSGPPLQVSAPAAVPQAVAPPAPAHIPSPIAAAASPDRAAGPSVPVFRKSPHLNTTSGTGAAAKDQVQPENAQRPTTQHAPSPWLHPRPWRPGHTAPVLLARAELKSHERPPEQTDFDVPRWLAEHNPPHPRVVVMSEPPHYLTQPPEKTVAQAAPPPASAPAQAAPHEQPAPQHAPVVVASSAYGTAPFGWPAYRPNYGGYYGPPQGSYYPSYYPPPYGGYYGGGYGAGAP